MVSNNATMLIKLDYTHQFALTTDVRDRLT